MPARFLSHDRIGCAQEWRLWWWVGFLMALFMGCYASVLEMLRSDHLDIHIKALGTEWRYTRFYGHPELARHG